MKRSDAGSWPTPWLSREAWPKQPTGVPDLRWQSSARCSDVDAETSEILVEAVAQEDVTDLAASLCRTCPARHRCYDAGVGDARQRHLGRDCDAGRPARAAAPPEGGVMRVVEGLCAWWAADRLLDVPLAPHEAGEAEVRLGRLVQDHDEQAPRVVDAVCDRVVLAVQGEGQAWLDRLGADDVWYEIATTGAWSGVYVGPWLDVRAVLTHVVRVRWSAGIFSVTLAVVPPARVRAA